MKLGHWLCWSAKEGSHLCLSSWPPKRCVSHSCQYPAQTYFQNTRGRIFFPKLAMFYLRNSKWTLHKWCRRPGVSKIKSFWVPNEKKHQILLVCTQLCYFLLFSSHTILINPWMYIRQWGYFAACCIFWPTTTPNTSHSAWASQKPLPWSLHLVKKLKESAFK